jgi:hypothetical protein
MARSRAAGKVQTAGSGAVGAMGFGAPKAGRKTEKARPNGSRERKDRSTVAIG